MRVVLDTNILMSALIKDSFTREFIIKSDHLFFVPEMVFESLLKHRPRILKKTDARPEDLDSLINVLSGYLVVLHQKEFEDHIKKAERAMKDIDIEDAVFVACALGLPGSAIWSDDKHLKKQNLVKVYTTKEILRI